VGEGQHLRPYKRLLVDVTASSAALDKALGFANDLFNALESSGYRVLISSPAENFTRPRIDDQEELPKVPRNEHSYDYNRLWSPQRPTVVYVGSIAFGLAVIEMSESVVLRYVNGKYIRESDYKPPKTSARYVDHSWTTTKNIPCGRLRLVVYAPHPGVSWSISFPPQNERRDGSLRWHTHLSEANIRHPQLRPHARLWNTLIARRAAARFKIRARL
jgi:hypothetical protein